MARISATAHLLVVASSATASFSRCCLAKSAMAGGQSTVNRFTSRPWLSGTQAAMNRRLVDEAYEALGPGDWEVCIRSDSAAYDQENLEHWNSRGWKFAVSADMSPALKGAVSSLPPQSWQLIDEKGG